MKIKGVYVITERATGKMYVGSSLNIRGRRAKHRNGKYPRDKFDFEVLLTCEENVTIDELDELERYYIRELGCLHPDGFNLTTGGRKGHEFCDALKAMKRQDDVDFVFIDGQWQSSR